MRDGGGKEKREERGRVDRNERGDRVRGGENEEG